MKETPTVDVDSRNVVKNRELLYRMIISQLHYDGFQPIAATLAAAVHADPPCPPSDSLQQALPAVYSKEAVASLTAEIILETPESQKQMFTQT